MISLESQIGSERQQGFNPNISYMCVCVCGLIAEDGRICSHYCTPENCSIRLNASDPLHDKPFTNPSQLRINIRSVSHHYHWQEDRSEREWLMTKWIAQRCVRRAAAPGLPVHPSFALCLICESGAEKLLGKHGEEEQVLRSIAVAGICI